MKKIRIGMVGLGSISHRFVKGAGFVEQAEIIAVASRSQERALQYAQTYGFPYAYGSYQEMLENEEIDAIYIATPNDTHRTYMMEALRYGKHVICEKPFTVHTAEASEVFAYAKQKKLVVMEAMKACFLPTTQMVKQWIHDGRIGNVRYIEAGYAYLADGVPQTHHLYTKERGGGSFYDVGIYPLAFVNEVHSAPIEEIVSENVWQNGIDTLTQVLIRYADGAVASIRSGILADMENTAILYGDKGTITVPQFWKSEYACLKTAQGRETVFEEPHNKSEFRYQIQHFVDLILNQKNESDIMSEKATLKNMEILEKVIFNE